METSNYFSFFKFQRIKNHHVRLNKYICWSMESVNRFQFFNTSKLKASDATSGLIEYISIRVFQYSLTFDGLDQFQKIMKQFWLLVIVQVLTITSSLIILWIYFIDIRKEFFNVKNCFVFYTINSQIICIFYARLCKFQYKTFSNF